MTLYEFLSKALKPEIYQRKGQRFMNTLAMHRPDLEAKLAAEGIDPFYDDSRLVAAIQWVKDNWERTENC
jgi:hypothetical protein